MGHRSYGWPLASCLALASGCARADAPAPEFAAYAAAERLSLPVCERAGLEEPLLCGTLTVPADREHPGATMTVAFLVVPALDGNPAGRVWVEHPGGPGMSILALARNFVVGADLEHFRRDRDILLVDQRGLGESGGLECEALGEARILEAYYSRNRVEACRREMEERGIDLTRYSTIDAVDDLDAVREQLGYRQLDLGGWSYGSKFMLTYAHRHPERVRTISVFVPTIADYRRPVDWPRFTEAALEGMFADCAAEPPCAAAFPDLRGDLRKLIERVEARPVTAEYQDPTTGERVSAIFDRARLVDELHFYLLKVPSLRRTPWLIHTAASGNFDPLIDYAVRMASGDGGRDEALYLSIVCPEEVARLSPEDARAAAEGTFVGTHFADEFRMACEAWNLPRHPDYPLPWRPLDVPVLVVAGDRDPITPVEYGEAIAAGFRRSKLLPIHRMPHHTSAMVGSRCLDEILLEFLATADPDGLDTRCVAEISAHPFLTDSVAP